MPNNCEYEGKTYSEGSEVCQSGRVMVCQNGTWNPTGATCDDTPKEPRKTETTEITEIIEKEG